MIIHLPISLDEILVTRLAQQVHAQCIKQSKVYVLVTSHQVQQLPPVLQPYAIAYWTMPTDMQLSSRDYHADTHRIDIADTYVGGDGTNQLIIAGPCAVESIEQMEVSCQMLKSLGIRVLRAGCFKPRTSAYTFRGLGYEGLEILDRMRRQYGLLIATEMNDATHADAVIECADIVQIGAKAMYDQQLLTAAGRSGKPILLKRSFGATLQELANSADFIMACGNEKVILCERGIRTFETATRFTLDLCGVAWLKQHVNVPIILDPSHAMGYAYGIPNLARACTAMGIDGLLIETHPHPSAALSDAAQQLNPEQFAAMYASIKPIAEAVGKHIQ